MRKTIYIGFGIGQISWYYIRPKRISKIKIAEAKIQKNVA
jgi:hypothetical protein